MARVPAGAELIENRMSGAPGIRLGNIFIMAGVPHITAGMLDALSGTLEGGRPMLRSEEHTSELQSLMRISYAVFCLKIKTKEQALSNKDSKANKHNRRSGTTRQHTVRP